MLVPSGVLLITHTSAPKSLKALTDDLYDAPLAQSKAIFNPDKSTDTVLLANFM